MVWLTEKWSCRAKLQLSVLWKGALASMPLVGYWRSGTRWLGSYIIVRLQRNQYRNKKTSTKHWLTTSKDFRLHSVEPSWFHTKDNSEQTAEILFWYSCLSVWFSCFWLTYPKLSSHWGLILMSYSCWYMGKFSRAMVLKGSSMSSTPICRGSPFVNFIPFTAPPTKRKSVFFFDIACSFALFLNRTDSLEPSSSWYFPLGLSLRWNKTKRVHESRVSQSHRWMVWAADICVQPP